MIFELDEVRTGAGAPYSVFTPYKNAWLKKLEPYYLKAYPVAHHAAALAAVPPGVSTDDIMRELRGRAPGDPYPEWDKPTLPKRR